jgi:hypothetical protein
MARTDSIKPLSLSLQLPSHQKRTTINPRQTNVVHEKVETDSLTSFISPNIENSDKLTLQLLVNLLTEVNIFIHLKCRKTLF